MMCNAVMPKVQHLLYQLIFLLLLPIYFLKLYRQDRPRISERWGNLPNQLPQQPIWIHAASYGEAKAAGILIETLRQQDQSCSFLITTTTATGGNAIQAFLTEGDRHFYAPIDLPWVINRWLKTVKPRALVVMEVELWPNLWRLCKQRNIPILLANARLSEKSMARYLKLLPQVWHATLNHAAKIMVQSTAIAQRFQRLGVKPHNIEVCGNLKYAIRTDEKIQQEGRLLRKMLGKTRPVWLAASTHEGEEALILDCHQRLLKKHPELVLIIVPRHPQRFDKVWELCRQSKLTCQRRSDQKQLPLASKTQLYLADTMGELLPFYAASDLCLVAGSFVDVGGHNILEPAAYNCPIVVGPDMTNFADITEEYLKQQAIRQVSDIDSLYETIYSLLKTPEAGFVQATNAARLLNPFRNSSEYQGQIILSQLTS